MKDCGDGYATSVPMVVEIQSPAECEGRPGELEAVFIFFLTIRAVVPIFSSFFFEP